MGSLGTEWGRHPAGRRAAAARAEAVRSAPRAVSRTPIARYGREHDPLHGAATGLSALPHCLQRRSDEGASRQVVVLHKCANVTRWNLYRSSRPGRDLLDLARAGKRDEARALMLQYKALEKQVLALQQRGGQQPSGSAPPPGTAPVSPPASSPAGAGETPLPPLPASQVLLVENIESCGLVSCASANLVHVGGRGFWSEGRG